MLLCLNVGSKKQRSIDFTTTVYYNPEKTSHETYHTKPVQILTTYYELISFIILISSVMFLIAIFWLKKKSMMIHQILLKSKIIKRN